MGEATRSLLMVGVGGQGVVLASNIVASALMACGYDVKKSEVHGMAQRGGIVYSHVRWGRAVASPLVARGGAQVLIAFEWAEGLRWLGYLQPGGTFIASTARVVPPIACRDRASWRPSYPLADLEALRRYTRDLRVVDARAVAAGLGNVRAANSVLLGVLAGVLDLPEQAWLNAIREGVPPKTVDVNVRAFEAGRALQAWSTPPAAASCAPGERHAYQVEIRARWCKGCEICVRICPEFCLAMDGSDKAVVAFPDACTGCRLCEWLCPDFAISVHPAQSSPEGPAAPQAEEPARVPVARMPGSQPASNGQAAPRGQPTAPADPMGAARGVGAHG